MKKVTEKRELVRLPYKYFMNFTYGTIEEMSQSIISWYRYGEHYHNGWLITCYEATLGGSFNEKFIKESKRRQPEMQIAIRVEFCSRWDEELSFEEAIKHLRIFSTQYVINNCYEGSFSRESQFGNCLESGLFPISVDFIGKENV